MKLLNLRTFVLFYFSVIKSNILKSYWTVFYITIRLKTMQNEYKSLCFLLSIDIQSSDWNEYIPCANSFWELFICRQSFHNITLRVTNEGSFTAVTCFTAVVSSLYILTVLYIFCVIISINTSICVRNLHTSIRIFVRK